MLVSEHFSLKELTKTEVRKDNTAPPNVIANLQALCKNVLEPVRAHFKLPVTVNSAYRSPAVNAAVGGSKTSQHMYGEAADIEISGVDNITLARWITQNVPFDQVILEFYTPGQPTSGWVHVSFRASGNRKEILTAARTGRGTHYSKGLPAA